MIDKTKLTHVCRQFGIQGELTSYKTFTDGHINSTHLAVFDGENGEEKYLVQNVNLAVFKNPQDLMENIVGVTRFLHKKLEAAGKDPYRHTLHFIKANNGKYYYSDGSSDCWRIYLFIDNSFTMNMMESGEIFEDVGREFGNFQRLLSDYPSECLKQIIPDFHNTPKRIENLLISAEADVRGRKKETEAELDFVLQRRERAGLALELLKSGRIPLRVTHNDTKLNNILFDAQTKRSICVIDLDTIMPGLSLYDFGDAIRFGAKTADEDEADLSRVSIDLGLYESYVRGYLDACASDLTEAEVEHLAYSAWLMTFECGVRFLTDYLDGDVYFKIDPAKPKHNLIRARNQLKMASEIELSLEKMQDITMRVYRQSRRD